MIRVLLALALAACTPSPRPTLPDLAPTLAQLTRIELWVETSQEQACAVPMKVEVRAECYYPNRIAAMEVARE